MSKGKAEECSQDEWKWNYVRMAEMKEERPIQYRQT